MTRLRTLGLAIAVGVLSSAPGAGQDDASSTVTPQQLERVRSLALEHLRARARDLGIEPAGLTISSSNVDQLSLIHVRIRQSLRGVPVFGGEAILHYRAGGELLGETIDLVPNVKVDTRPQVAAADAMARAIKDGGCGDCAAGSSGADLWVIRLEGKDHLAYRVQLSGRNGTRPTRPVVFVDAHDGRIVWRYDNLQTGGK
jgi:Zn-dependent metalloprotease